VAQYNGGKFTEFQIRRHIKLEGRHGILDRVDDIDSPQSLSLSLTPYYYALPDAYRLGPPRSLDLPDDGSFGEGSIARSVIC
jgi:hypothetical protein